MIKQYLKTVSRVLQIMVKAFRMTLKFKAKPPVIRIIRLQKDLPTLTFRNKKGYS